MRLQLTQSQRYLNAGIQLKFTKHFVTDFDAIYEEKWMSNYGRYFKQDKRKGKFHPRTGHEGPIWE
jgi:hypothetical protein